MRDHVRHVCRSCFYQLRQLRVVRRSLTIEASAQLVHAFINSRLDYCNSLLAGVSDQLIGQLQSVLRAAARLVLQKKKFESPMTFETSYTGFRSGSESRSNFVCLFSAACAVKPLHTSRRCSLLYRTVMRCDRIVRRLEVISSYREHSPRLSALVGLRSLDRLHGTHSHHPWKTKICRPQSSDLNSKLTCLIPGTFVSSIYVSLGYIFDC